MKSSYAFAGLAAGLVSVAALVARADDTPKAAVGQPAPAISLPDTTGATQTLEQYKGKIVVLEWFNADCPFVVKHHKRFKTMKETFARYKGKDVVWLAICSSAEGKQGAGVERNKRARDEYGMEYPILLDANGAVGRTYGATNTPHMYVIDAKGVLQYAGAIDDDRSPDKQGATNYVAQAVDALLEGKAVPTANTRAYGCGVKY